MIRIGIICPSEIAFRRFLPALQQASDKFQFTAIGIASPEEWFGDISNVSSDIIAKQQNGELAKARQFTEQYGGKVITGYYALVSSPEIDAVYCPLPPALHYQWAKLALENDKHVFLEKPSTTSYADTEALITLASKKKSSSARELYVYISFTNRRNK